MTVMVLPDLSFNPTTPSLRSTVRFGLVLTRGVQDLSPRIQDEDGFIRSGVDLGFSKRVGQFFRFPFVCEMTNSLISPILAQERIHCTTGSCRYVQNPNKKRTHSCCWFSDLTLKSPERDLEELFIHHMS